MNEDILDDIFSDDFRSLLQEDEVVLWEGKPQEGGEQTFNRFIRWFLLLMTIPQFYYRNFTVAIFLFLVFILGLIKERFESQKRKNTRYLITNKRVLFQLWNKKKKEFHSVPLEDIKRVKSETQFSKNGVIYLVLKKGVKANFKTSNLSALGKRSSPTLELIEDPHKIEAIINQEVKLLN